ncbi:MAG TPA: hypothetical protein VIK18_04930, partial [Pirellulales bacterium]
MVVAFCLTGCGHEKGNVDSLSSVVAELARLNERVAGVLAAIEVWGGADSHAPQLMTLAGELEQLAERTEKL